MISEVDIADWERLPIQELYKVAPKTWVELVATKDVLFFDHLDGMYSYCKDMMGNIIHIAGWAEVHPLKNPDSI